MALEVFMDNFGLAWDHCLTSQGNWEPRIDFELLEWTKSYLHYNKFAVGTASDRYRLSISEFDSIGLNDVFGGHSQNGLRFMSCDQDNNLRTELAVIVVGGGITTGHITLNNVYIYIYSQLYLNGD